MSRAFLVATALLCGAIVMVIEVLGSRVIGPFFGVSLYVWTSLITVTLVALAAGYAAGGVVSDRRGTPDALYGVIAAAGVLVLAIPFARAPVLRACVPLGLRAGALVASAILFGPPLFLLGCVSPLLVRIATREWATLGRTVGALYALSTVGSFAGTVLTGFVLVARFGVGRVFGLAGAILLALAAIWFAGFRRRRAALAILPVAAVPLALLATSGAPVAVVRDDGVRVVQRARVDGAYGSLRVVDYEGESTSRALLIDGLTQGEIDLESHRSLVGYTYSVAALSGSARPDARRALVVGLGAAILPRWFEARGVRTDVVDIDPGVVALAREWFGFAPAGDVVVDDARHYLATTDRTWDVVVLDAFNGDTTPAHLLSAEALAAVARRLAPRGVVVANLIVSLREERFTTASIARTFREVFPAVSLYPLFDPETDADGLGNVTVFATLDPAVHPDRSRLPDLDEHPLAGIDPPDLFRRFEFPEGEPAMVLTDDHNPVDVRDVWLRERLRERILRYTDWDVLL